MNLTLESQLEAFLFYRGEAVSFSEIAAALSTSPEQVQTAVETLNAQLQARGVRLVISNGTVAMVTAPEMSAVIERVRKEELSSELSRAAAETLAIVLYQGPLTRADIDYIRGVNSTFILRNLQIRGLIEKAAHPERERTFTYRPSAELLAHLGITRIEELPEFDKVKRELEAFTAQTGEEAAAGEPPVTDNHDGAGESNRD